jgi:hypothetical protein
MQTEVSKTWGRWLARLGLIGLADASPPGTGLMQWTVRLKARASGGEVTTTELLTFSRPVVVSTLAEVGLVLSETKTLSAKL